MTTLKNKEITLTKAVHCASVFNWDTSKKVMQSEDVKEAVLEFQELEFYNCEGRECFYCGHNKLRPIKTEFDTPDGKTYFMCLDCAIVEIFGNFQDEINKKNKK